MNCSYNQKDLCVLKMVSAGLFCRQIDTDRRLLAFPDTDRKDVKRK